MIDTDKYEGHAKGNWNWGKQGSTDNGDGTIMIRPFTQLESKSGVTLLAIHHGDAKQSDLKLIADAPLLLAEVKGYRLQDYAIKQAEAMKAQVGDNTWHYAMEVWLYPETHYWDYDEEGTVQLIERYITTNRDTWIKHWGKPSEVARKRCEE